MGEGTQKGGGKDNEKAPRVQPDPARPPNTAASGYPPTPDASPAQLEPPKVTAIVSSDMLIRAAVQVGKDVQLYRFGAGFELGRVNRNYGSLSPDDISDLVEYPPAALARLKTGVEQNQRFLSAMMQSCAPSEFIAGLPSPTFSAEQPGSQARAATGRMTVLLRQCVREWSSVGERDRGCFARVLDALQGHRKVGKVLIPGCGLGRLAYEAAARGYEVEAVDGSPTMLIAGSALRNMAPLPVQASILRLCNRPKKDSNARVAIVPDVPPKSLGDPRIVCAEFVERYRSAEFASSQDAVATTFFLDTGGSALDYVRTIAHVLRPGGVWVNYGPICYSYSCADNSAPPLCVSFAWNELRLAIEAFFEIKGEVEWELSTYCGEDWAMMYTRYDSAFFSAVRRAP